MANKILLIFLLTCFSTSSPGETIGQLLKKIAKGGKVTKRGQALPQFQKIKRKYKKDIAPIKPPQFSGVFDYGGSDYARIEKEVDRGISQLVRLLEKYGDSPNRGEYWVRLGEFYSEKAQLIEFRMQEKFQEQMELYRQKKRASRPKMNSKNAKVYNRKAIQLYSWFLKDFPKDPKTDQALFFLGYNHFELGQIKKGMTFYKRIAKHYPRSEYINETHFAMAEHYFDSQKWKRALRHYYKVSKATGHRLQSLSLYKVAWSLHKTSQYKKAFFYIDRVLRLPSQKNLRKVSLSEQAINDLVLFYADGASYLRAEAYFTDMIKDPKLREEKLRQLADYYSYSGRYGKSVHIYKQLIKKNPFSLAAFDYQEEVVNNFVDSKKQKKFWSELNVWLKNYGENSSWYKKNKSQKEARVKVLRVENFLRNMVLSEHQQAQKTRSPYVQAKALKGYVLYLKSFKKVPKYSEMLFFYGELLFDMGRFADAAKAYKKVASFGDEKTPYFSKSLRNIVLSYGKLLPSYKEVQKSVAGKTQKISFKGNVKNFMRAALKYLESNPKNRKDRLEIEYKMATFYYYYNQFEEATVYFMRILQKFPKSSYAEYSANLILDIYNLRKDYGGLVKASSEILRIKGISKAVKKQVWFIRVKAIFADIKAKENERSPLENAKKYESFAKKYKRSSSSVEAAYNAGVNYEKAKKRFKAIEMYNLVVRSPLKGVKKEIRVNALRYVSFLYRQLAQYVKAVSYFELFVKKYPKHKDAEDMIYNIAVLKEGMGQYKRALHYYERYLKTSKRKDRFETLYILAKLWEKQRNYLRAISYYRKYINSPSARPYEALESAVRIGRIQILLKQYNSFFKTRSLVQNLYNKYKKQGVEPGLQFLAEAEFEFVRLTIYKRFKKIRIVGTPAKQQKALQKRLKLLNQLKEQLKRIVAFDVGEQVVSSLALQGDAAYDLYNSIVKSPLPKGLGKSQIKQYKEQLNKVAAPFKKSAADAVAKAVEKGRELNVYGRQLRQAINVLRKINPLHPAAGLEKAFLVAVEAEIGTQQRDGGTGESEKDFLKIHHTEAQVLKALKPFFQEKGKDKKGFNILALYYYRSKKYKMAKVVLNEALKLHKRDPLFYNNLGVILLKEGDVKGAQDNFESALKRDSGFVPSVINLAGIAAFYKDYERVKKLSKKQSLFDYYSRWGQEYIKAISNYALALSYLEGQSKAHVYYTKALQVGSNPWIEFNKIFFVARTQKNFKSAETEFRKLLTKPMGAYQKRDIRKRIKWFKEFKQKLQTKV